LTKNVTFHNPDSTGKKFRPYNQITACQLIRRGGFQTRPGILTTTSYHEIYSVSGYVSSGWLRIGIGARSINGGFRFIKGSAGNFIGYCIRFVFQRFRTTKMHRKGGNNPTDNRPFHNHMVCYNQWQL